MSFVRADMLMQVRTVRVRSGALPMSIPTGTGHDHAYASKPDGPYALVAGLYASAHLAPLILLAVSGVVTNGGVRYLTFLLTVTGVTAVSGWLVSRAPGLAVTVGRHDITWLLVVAPLAWFGGWYVGFGPLGVDPPTFVAALSVLGVVGGMLCGLLLVTMSRTRHADAATADVTEFVAWEARWPRRWRRVASAVSIGAFAVGAVGFAGAFVLGDEWWGWGLYNVVFVGAVLMNVLNPRTFRVTEAGLVVEHPFVRRFRPWSAFAGYEVTTDALVIEPTNWWRLAHRCDRDDIDDFDAATAALDGVFG